MLGLLLVHRGAFYAVLPPIVNEVAAFVGSVPDLLGSLQQNATIRRISTRSSV